MIHIQIINTDIIYELRDDNEPEIKAKLKAWFPDTKVLIVETGEIVERNTIFE